MNSEQYIQLTAHLENVINKTVNGKIDKPTRDVADIAVSIKPVIEFYENITFTDKAVRWFLSLVMAVAAAVGISFAAIKYLK